VIPSPLAPVRDRPPASYADGSALVQCLPDGPFHEAWSQWRAGRRLVTSQVGITELHGIAWPRGPRARDVADEVEASLEVLRFTEKALEVASHVSTALSSFVALHIGTAVAHPDVDTVVTYQTDLARVAALYQLRVVTPGWPDRWWEGAP